VNVDVVALALVEDAPAIPGVAAALFPEAGLRSFKHAELRPAGPFVGPLFDVLAAQPRGACVGLVVPVEWCRSPLPTGWVLAVADHVNLELRGPLGGRWPDGVPRAFPNLTGVYQPAVIRARGGPRVYSSDVVVAGVADAGRLTPFEAGAVREQGLLAVTDSLVPSAIVAAYYGLKLAACGVPRATERKRE
jgi:hypothetical protein